MAFGYGNQSQLILDKFEVFGRGASEVKNEREVRKGMRAKSLQSRLTFFNPMGCSLPGSFVHGILQARILEWVAHVILQGIFQTQEMNPCLLHCRWILYHWGTGIGVFQAKRIASARALRGKENGMAKITEKTVQYEVRKVIMNDLVAQSSCLCLYFGWGGKPLKGIRERRDIICSMF